MSDIGNRDNMSENISRYLEARGMSQQNLAEQLSVSRATVSAWILKKTYPRIDKIEMMSRIFGCTKSDLVEKEGTVTHTYEMSNEEYMMLCLWRQADNDTRRMVARLLSYPGRPAEVERRKDA